MRPLRDTTRAAASAGGQVLRAATALAAVRPAAKPLHPFGTVVHGRLLRTGSPEPSGAEWLDATGEDRVLVRQSRAVGLPLPSADVFGLALRAPTGPTSYGDLLLATTGLGRLTRYTLTPALSPWGRPMTTLLPYRTAAGPVLVSATFEDDVTVALAWAVGSGAWHRFARLELGERPADGPDAEVSFDPVENTLPGLETYPWVRRLREPAYRTARRTR